MPPELLILPHGSITAGRQHHLQIALLKRMMQPRQSSLWLPHPSALHLKTWTMDQWRSIRVELRAAQPLLQVTSRRKWQG